MLVASAPIPQAPFWAAAAVIVAIATGGSASGVASRHPPVAGGAEHAPRSLALPHLAGVVVESIERAARTVTFCAHSAVPTARCPRCGLVSWRVHGRYARPARSRAVGGAPAVVELVLRRFK
ncbi:transposase family protein [Streptomyces ureilyticus]|uniref:transposase family protein n=1 Tax=Streptomyces ureilyticus TaxID=1775131 RepID=UPI0038B6AE93